MEFTKANVEELLNKMEKDIKKTDEVTDEFKQGYLRAIVQIRFVVSINMEELA